MPLIFYQKQNYCGRHDKVNEVNLIMPEEPEVEPDSDHRILK